MEQRHPSSYASSSMPSSPSRSRCKQRWTAAATAAILATGWMVQSAEAAVTGAGRINSGRSVHHLQSRQYPSDAPSCAQLCIRVKIEEAADPGLAPTCDYRTSGYVACLCASNKFTAAYEQCLLDNCVFPSSLATGRSLFQTFCAATGSGSAASQAVSVASSAVASQASVYSETATRNRTSTSTSTSASSTSGGNSTSTSSGVNSSGASTGTGTNTQTGTTSPASTNTQSTLDAAQISRARMNATGVSSARHTKVSLPTWTLATSATFVLLGSLLILA